MTTSTPRADFAARPTPPHAAPRFRRTRAAAFTLSEVLVATTLSAFILAGVLSTFLFIGRTGLNAAAYAEMNGELRRAVERFNHDVRLAVDVRWTDARRLTLLLPADVGPAVTYAYESAADPASPGRFVRLAGDTPAEVLVAKVAPDFAFARYRLPDPARAEPPVAANDLETKQLELSLRALRPAATLPAASQLALSARCVLRNKSTGQ